MAVLERALRKMKVTCKIKRCAQLHIPVNVPGVPGRCCFRHDRYDVWSVRYQEVTLHQVFPHP